MSYKIYLPTVPDSETKEDAVIAGAMPLIKGNDEESLACGACKSVLARETSTRTIFERFSSANGRIILKCECGANNVVRVTT